MDIEDMDREELEDRIRDLENRDKNKDDEIKRLRNQLESIDEEEDEGNPARQFETAKNYGNKQDKSGDDESNVVQAIRGNQDDPKQEDSSDKVDQESFENLVEDVNSLREDMGAVKEKAERFNIETPQELIDNTIDATVERLRKEGFETEKEPLKEEVMDDLQQKAYNKIKEKISGMSSNQKKTVVYLETVEDKYVLKDKIASKALGYDQGYGDIVEEEWRTLAKHGMLEIKGDKIKSVFQERCMEILRGHGIEDQEMKELYRRAFADLKEKIDFNSPAS